MTILPATQIIIQYLNDVTLIMSYNVLGSPKVGSDMLLCSANVGKDAIFWFKSNASEYVWKTKLTWLLFQRVNVETGIVN